MTLYGHQYQLKVQGNPLVLQPFHCRVPHIQHKQLSQSSSIFCFPTTKSARNSCSSSLNTPYRFNILNLYGKSASSTRCPVRSGWSAASLSATGRGVRTGQVWSIECFFFSPANSVSSITSYVLIWLKYGDIILSFRCKYKWLFLRI